MDVDNESEVLCEKIINDINAVFIKDPDLVSFEIIPTISNQNKTPVKHVEHNLGLESWCIKHLYDHAHKTIMAHRKEEQLHPANQRYPQNGDNIIKYLNVALLINPDVTTFWHMRRKLVQKNRLKVHREFQFCLLILSKKPKSNEAFAYRRWLFSFESSESIDWPLEIGICDRCADRSASNYAAWTHRYWVLLRAPFLLKSEILHTEKFVLKHISDYSGYHYRQELLAKAYELSFYVIEDLQHLAHLRQLIAYYLDTDVCTTEQILGTLLPNVSDFNVLGEERLKSFLYCCNLAAHDIKLADDQKNMYGARESFENHRRAALKFIVDHCVHLNMGEYRYGLSAPTTPTEEELQHKLTLHARFDYTTNAFLMALKRSEGLLGEKHRRWCSIFLGFDYTTS